MVIIAKGESVFCKRCEVIIYVRGSDSHMMDEGALETGICNSGQ